MSKTKQEALESIANQLIDIIISQLDEKVKGGKIDVEKITKK